MLHGMIKQAAIYALTCGVLWVDWLDPGLCCAINPSNNTAGQADVLVKHTFNKLVFDSQHNIRRAVMNSLNVSVPQAYRRVVGGGVGIRNYCPTNNPLDVLNGPHRFFGKMRPAERTAMEIHYKQGGTQRIRLRCSLIVSRNVS